MEEARVPLSPEAAPVRRASPEEVQEAQLPLLAAVFQSLMVGLGREQEGQLPSAAGSRAWKAALEEAAKTRLPVLEAEPYSPGAEVAEGSQGIQVVQGEPRSRPDAPEEEASALAPTLEAALKAPARTAAPGAA